MASGGNESRIRNLSVELPKQIQILQSTCLPQIRRKCSWLDPLRTAKDFHIVYNMHRDAFSHSPQYNTFIHSFIPDIYKAPLQEACSEALSVQLYTVKGKCLKKLDYTIQYKYTIQLCIKIILPSFVFPKFRSDTYIKLVN